ncbi:MAG: hypothetical protein HYR73_08690 [Candidatus Eisenbacteria bacterium]|nr:hypothetical protein [Candidatus Eisenbacteria bacterium]
MKRWIAALAMLIALCTCAATARAQHPGGGNSMFWLGLIGNRAQLVGPTTGETNTFENPEAGVHVAYSYFLSDEWTACVSGAYQVNSSEFSAAIVPDQKFTSSSYVIRIGGDRFAFINDRAAVYAGPGITYWRGRGKFEGNPAPGVNGDWPDVTQYGFNGRLGLWARLGGPWALYGHIGQVIAHNSAKDTKGENTWWTSHHEGSVGLSLDF